MIKIINVHGIDLPAGAVYLGRSARGLVGSPLANPFYMARESDRPKVIKQYRVWLPEKLKDPKSRQSHAFESLVLKAKEAKANGEDLIIACWCTPLACHLEYVKELLESRLEADDHAASLGS